MKFGIELEFTAATIFANSKCYGPFYDYLLQLIRESGIQDWRIEQDASCGNEIVSPILDGKKGLNQVMQVCHCAQMAQEQFALNSLLGPDCGVHFHFDARDLLKQSDASVVAIRNVLLLSVILEPLWYSMNPGIRFDTAFAAPLNFNMFQMVRARDMTDIRDIWFRSYMGVNCHSDSYRVKQQSYSPVFINSNQNPEKYDWTRYHGMNLVSLFKHGSIEFRYTHGSFDPSNIEMWFNHFKQIVEVSRSISTRKIIRACPMNINDMKMNSVAGLQNLIYGDLRLGVEFLFNMIPQDGHMLKFVLEKLIKYNPDSFNPTFVKRIWKEDGSSFAALMNCLGGTRIPSYHTHRNRHRFTPPDHQINHPEEGGIDYPTEAVGFDD